MDKKIEMTKEDAKQLSELLVNAVSSHAKLRSLVVEFRDRARIAAEQLDKSSPGQKIMMETARSVLLACADKVERILDEQKLDNDEYRNRPSN
jgi:hypothetical protein